MNSPAHSPVVQTPDDILHDPYRLAALRRTQLLDTIAEEEFDRLSRLAVRVLRAPIALVSLVDDNRQFFKSCIGLDEPLASERETPLSHSFCQHAVTAREPLIIADAREHPLVRENLAIRDLNVIAYAGIPLITHDGAAIGSFCVIDHEPRAWTDDDIAILKDLAAAVLTEIELRLTMAEAQLRLADAERERAEKEAILESIADAFFALDTEWRFSYLNSETERTLQRVRADLMGQSLWVAFPDMVDTPFFAACHRASVEQTTVIFEAFYGPVARWFQVRVYPTASGLSVYMHDITQQLAEGQLAQESDQRLRLALDAASMGTWDWDLRTDRVHLPPEVAAIQRARAGDSAESFAAMLAMVHADDRPGVELALREALSTQSSFKIQVRTFDAAGVPCWRHVEGRAIYDAAGQPLRVVGIDMDINAQKEVELALRTSQERLRRILETNASGIMFLNDSGEVVFVNSAAEQILGLSPNTLVGNSINAADWKLFSMDGSPLPEADMPFVRAMRTGEQVCDSEFAFVRPDGTRVMIVANAAPVRDTNGRIEGIVTSFIDQTARRRAADGQRFLAEAAKLLSTSLDHEVTLAQLAALAVPELADWCTVHMFDAQGLHRIAAAHIDPQKAHLIRDMQAQFPVEAASAHPIARALRTGRTVVVAKTAAPEPGLVLGEGHTTLLSRLGWESLMVVPLVARGTTLGVISFVSARPGRRYDAEDQRLAEEVTHRAAMAVDNALLYREAQQAVSARDALFSMVTHDLKNPLTAIKGYVDMLKRRLSRDAVIDPGRFAGGLANIESSAVKIERQLNALVDTSLLRNGQPIDLAYVPTDLGAIVQQVADEMRPTTRRHTIEVQGAPSALVGAYDPVRIERVFANLLANAIKYSPNGGTIAVEMASEQGVAGPQAVVSVRDQGIGVPRADLPRIFEQFTRASNVGDVGGTGVGLASARQIVEQHGGTIEVETVEGAGSTFTVRLPLGHNVGAAA